MVKKIDSFDFGSIVIDKKHYTHDVLILPDGTVKRREPTKGKHKITAKEMENLHDMQADIIIIGNGADGNARLTKNAQGYLKDINITPVILGTPLAVERVNQEINDGKRVAALIHITC